jgi:hypothetical protein
MIENSRIGFARRGSGGSESMDCHHTPVSHVGVVRITDQGRTVFRQLVQTFFQEKQVQESTITENRNKNYREILHWLSNR